ncbi:MAG: acetate--CoA ligase family protein [Acidobacteria bacterium]|nr:acetate--CoA ligase family protein [Acidobacteriota bacterium]
MTSPQRPPSTDSLTALLEPNSVAIIGASDNPTRIGGRPLHYTKDAGFSGAIYPVNPNRDTVQGLPAFASIGDVPGPVDTAIVAVPASTVVATAEDCASAGVKAIVIFSAGFAEMGEEGQRRQAALSRIASSTGMRIVGPNCLGVYNPEHGFFGTFTTTFEAGRPQTGRVGVVSQSGAYGAHLSLLATRRGIGIRFWVTTGNECDVTVAETIGWLANHPDVSVIVAYAEGIRDRDRLFAALALAHERRKPVIFQKVGRTEIGAAAVRSHTASLAGSDAVYEGVFRQFGVYRATSTEEMLDVAYAASFGTFPSSRRVGLVSISGGVGVQMADEAVQRGLDVTPMSEAAQAKLKAVLPFGSPRNPVDITAHAFNDPGLVGTNLDVMLAEGTYDSIVAFFTYVAAAESMVGPISDSMRTAKAAHPECLLVLSIVGPREVVARYEEAGCPVFEDPTRAVRAVDALSGFSQSFARPLSDVTLPQRPTRPLPAGPIGEMVAKQLFAEAGVATVNERLCVTADDAVSAADALGFPVALKIASPDIPHKTDIGGVVLGLNSADEVRDAFDAVTRRARMAAPDAQIDGALVSRMVTGGVETIMGVQQDPTFGPVVMFGLGGVLVEVLKDVAFRVAPFDVAEAHRMMRELRGFPLLEGVRGRPRGDIAATASALAALSRFAAAHQDDLESAELNPVVVLPEGQGLVALDALIVPKAHATRRRPTRPSSSRRVPESG